MLVSGADKGFSEEVRPERRKDKLPRTNLKHLVARDQLHAFRRLMRICAPIYSMFGLGPGLSADICMELGSQNAIPYETK